MTGPEEKPVQEDRREYFRVNDAVRLSISPVPDDQIGSLWQRLEEKVAGGFAVMSSLAGISAEMAISMRRIENADPDIAAYLRALDRKVELLGRAFVVQEHELMEEPAHPVNLSAGGMCALVNEQYQPGQTLEVKMLLYPSLTGVVMYAAVVDCTPVGDEEHQEYRYRLRLEFTHMREQDRDLLIRHVLRCQGNELRKKDPVPRDEG
jgi:c-di-GMP-binding flagellar brake protein YcgR